MNQETKKVVPVLLLTGTEEKKPQRYHGIILCSKKLDR